MDFVEPSREERQRAANAYVCWVLALPDLAATAQPSSAWFRGHLRQALALGLIEGAVLIAVVALPALLTGALLAMHVAITTRATVWIYAVGVVADVAAFAIAVTLGFALAARAARGERFSVAFLPRRASRDDTRSG